MLFILGLVMSQAKWALDYLPVGAANRFFIPPAGPNLLSSAQPLPVPVEQVGNDRIWGYMLHALLCFLCAIVVAIPVARAFGVSTSRKKGPDPEVIKTIILLPVAITGLVLMVQHSLALAFSLAGLVAGAGVRFRSNVRDVSDTLFFLIAIAIGLASGVGSLGLAILMSLVFCYTSLVLKWLKIDGQNPRKHRLQETPADRKE